ncbi:hypothetical protein MAR_021147 [Mya arenaria]|uniref:DNA-directed DNA polymerase n=1 Tax=Mya arenaria TaxID=6604 RepID=A0ABY7E6V7_MYAAR|nr:hypothetical protein MAR_021147 [Mya arenaria]
MIEKGIRGGVSTIMTRYGKASNKYMGDEFNPKNDSTYLQYLDANNLYGWALSKPLPTTKATNDFEKDFFKLMNNSVFGKTMENIRNRVDIRLVNNETKAVKLSSKPNYKHCTIFDENLVAVHMKKTKIRFDKPVYLGMCILDLSKTLMYDFHYNYIKPNYILDAYGSSGAKLLFTDTDKQLFDTSNFPADHPSGIKSGVNKKVVGMFKDECGGKIMHELVGLRAKLYSYRMYEGNEPLARLKEEKRCKGVKQSVVKKEISFDDYKTCLFSRKEQIRKMNVIRSHGYEILTEEVKKKVLSANDDKQVIQEDGMHTLAYGHWRLGLSDSHARLTVKNLGSEFR